MKRILNTFFILVCFLGCKTDYTPLGYSTVNSFSIVGTWEWTKTVSSWTGEITTPNEGGYWENKIFKQDSTLKVYRNNTLIAKYKYSITYTDSTKTSVRGNLQIFQGAHPTFFIENNILILSEAYVDGPTSYYNRIK